MKYYLALFMYTVITAIIALLTAIFVGFVKFLSQMPPEEAFLGLLIITLFLVQPLIWVYIKETLERMESD